MTVPDPPAEETLGSAFREAFRRHVSTVSVVTFRDAAGRARGMTATAMCSLSVDPPRLLVCINRSNRCHEEILTAGRFGIDILSESQRQVSVHCSTAGSDKLLFDSWLTPGADAEAPPVLRAALGHFDCTVSAVHPESSHSVIVGSVNRVSLGPPALPLLYRDGAYRALENDDPVQHQLYLERLVVTSL